MSMLNPTDWSSMEFALIVSELDQPKLNIGGSDGYSTPPDLKPTYSHIGDIPGSTHRCVSFP